VLRKLRYEEKYEGRINGKGVMKYEMGLCRKGSKKFRWEANLKETWGGNYKRCLDGK
jgi:hypothetical protein